MKILFVCTGNTCRSPLAEVLYNRLTDEGEAKSAGFTTGGFPATREAILVAKENQLSLDRHRSQQITPDLMDWADLVLCMTQGHKEVLEQYFPKKDIYTMYGYICKEQKDVEDPFGRGPEAYRKTFLELEMLLKLWLD